MKVYELIQELVQYDADREVEINVVADEFAVTVTDDEGIEIDTNVDLDEDVTEFDVEEYRTYKGRKAVRITVVLD